MLNPVVVVFKGAAGVVRRVDEDALHLPCEVLLQGLEGEQVVAVDQDVVENVVVSGAGLGVVRLVRLLHQDARL
jgi:hypothetical protein